MKDKVTKFIGEHTYAICCATVGLSLTLIGHTLDREFKAIGEIIANHGEVINDIGYELTKNGVL